MKTRLEVEDMLSYVELDPELKDTFYRGLLIMALEWVLDEGISTSEGLETWVFNFYAEDER